MDFLPMSLSGPTMRDFIRPFGATKQGWIGKMTGFSYLNMAK